MEISEKSFWGPFGVMHEHLEAIKEAKEEFSVEDLMQILKLMARSFYSSDRDLRLHNDLQGEQKRFEDLHKGLYFDKAGIPIQVNHVRKIMFLFWVTSSPNIFAVAYRLGAEKEITVSKLKNTFRAAKGRRLIGASSRAKVAKSSEQFRHLTKQNASIEMASLVNLDSGTIKRYLSELFPGDKWKL